MKLEEGEEIETIIKRCEYDNINSDAAKNKLERNRDDLKRLKGSEEYKRELEEKEKEKIKKRISLNKIGKKCSNLRYNKSLQKKSLLFAKRSHIRYTKNELINIFRDLKSISEENIEEIMPICKKYGRSYYAFEHFLRTRNCYLVTGKIPKEDHGTKLKGTYIEPTTDLMEEALKFVHKNEINR